MPLTSAQCSEIESRVCGDLAARHDRMLTELGALVSIPTGGGFAPGLDECRGLLLDRLTAIGAEVELVAGQPRPTWLEIVTPGQGPKDPTPPQPIAVAGRRIDGQPSILLACHLDTVFDPNGSFQTMKIASDGATAVGPGVVDMKGGVLILLHALEALASAGVDVSYTLALTSDEETGSFSSDAVLRDLAHRHDIGIATEPALPGGELAIERLGSGQFRIETRGTSAHVGRAFSEGVSAVTALARAVVRVAEMPDPERGVIVNVGPLAGGAATNAVPDLARAWGNMRYPTRESADALDAKLAALETDADAMPSVRVDRVFNRPAKPLTPAVERLARVARGAAESLGQRLPFTSTGGVCDGNILQDEGLPTIDTLGVRGGGLHTHDEWIDLTSLVERSQLMATLLIRLSQGALQE